MKYILENEQESKRLKLQETISVYNLRNDLSDFDVKPSDTILDAGCGAGVISLHLRENYKFKDLYSCDFSELRLMQAQKYLKENGVHGTNFFQCDLSAIPQKENLVDKIICRFVYEYLPDPLKVTKELHRVCKPGGTVRIIDLDGVVVNLETKNQELKTMLETLTETSLRKYHLDFFAGRKVFTQMKLAGFKDIDCQVRPMYFNREDVLKERANYVERFTFARNILDDAFGPRAQYFIDLYLDELVNEENLLFYNNFVVTGTK